MHLVVPPGVRHMLMCGGLNNLMLAVVMLMLLN